MVVATVAGQALQTSVSQAVEEDIMAEGGKAEISEELKLTTATLYHKNEQTKESCADQEFSLVMEWAQENPGFCRSVASHPESTIVLASIAFISYHSISSFTLTIKLLQLQLLMALNF